MNKQERTTMSVREMGHILIRLRRWLNFWMSPLTLRILSSHFPLPNALSIKYMEKLRDKANC